MNILLKDKRMISDQFIPTIVASIELEISAEIIQDASAIGCLDEVYREIGKEIVRTITEK